MSIKDETVSFSLEVNVEKAYEDLRKAEMIIYRISGMVRDLSGDENLDNLMRMLQEATARANQLRLVLAALATARAAGGDPLAWIQLGVSVATVGVDLATEVYSR